MKCHCCAFLNSDQNWLVVSTHLKNISQIGNLPQIGVKIKNVWNHHLENHKLQFHLGVSVYPTTMKPSVISKSPQRGVKTSMVGWWEISNSEYSHCCIPPMSCTSFRKYLQSLFAPKININPQAKNLGTFFGWWFQPIWNILVKLEIFPK